MRPDDEDDPLAEIPKMYAPKAKEPAATTAQ